MIETKIDKSAVCTAFACAIAAFACGFAFCLAMLSNSGSCYFLIKDFLFSTRGYAWVQEIRALMGATVFDAAQIVLLILILFIAVSVVIVRFLQIFRKSVQESKTKIEEQSVDVFPPFTAFENSIPQSESKNENNIEQAEEDKKTENNWEKLNSLSSEVLCRYLKCECPQVAAIVLEKLNSELSARVLSSFDTNFAAEVVSAMLENRQPDTQLSETIGRTVFENIHTQKNENRLQKVYEIFHFMDDSIENKVLKIIKENNPTAADEISEENILFEDLQKLTLAETAEFLSQIDEAKLVIALRGASEKLRSHLYAAMPVRQSNLIKEALQKLGPIKLRDIEKAQQEILSVGKKMYAGALRSRKYE